MRSVEGAHNRGGVRALLGLLMGIAVVAGGAAAGAQYDPPAGYYDGATGSGTTLLHNLHDIIDNHVVRSYDAAKYALRLLDEDPNNPNNVILLYTGASAPETWDPDNNWDREHQWPRSRGVGDDGPDFSDLFNLRPCDPVTNGNRSAKPYGIGSGYWDPLAVALPGVNHRGDCSRGIFYMAARYDGSEAGTTQLTIVNGFPSGNQMGDLSKMLVWHYSDPVDQSERRRNHLVYSSQDNPSYYQGNRNPFIDHPEFVWPIWGDGDEDSKLYFGSTPPADGASTTAVDFGNVARGDPVPAPQSVTLNKTGNDPTYYEITVAGNAVCALAGRGNAFVGGAGSASIPVGLPEGCTTTPGLKTGTITIDNLALLNQGPGTGALDGNDVIAVSINVVGCHVPYADADGDGDVDLSDFAELQRCYSGENHLFPEGCFCQDYDGDNDVDMLDFAAFSACLDTSGPNIPAAPDCH